MRREPRALLWDARTAAEPIRRFVSGKSQDEFTKDQLLRSGVERQFVIIGEALSQLAKLQPDLAAKVPDLPRIVAFPNIPVHGYAAVEGGLLYESPYTDLHPLGPDGLFEVAQVEALLSVLDEVKGRAVA
jgi:uncharacterized protein with HEPN domain